MICPSISTSKIASGADSNRWLNARAALSFVRSWVLAAGSLEWEEFDMLESASGRYARNQIVSHLRSAVRVRYKSFMTDEHEEEAHPILRSRREVLQHYVGDLVYGANDGIITTFAVVAGVIGAQLPTRIVVIMGVANLLADGFSMGASNYLAIRSRGSAEQAVGRRISEPYAMRHGLVTFSAFVTAGMVPLIAYLTPAVKENHFEWTTLLALMALFSIGASRSLVVAGSWLRNGLEMLIVGGAAGSVSYFVGSLVSRWTGMSL
jgi:vacuolar iron transporter family protein